MSEKMSEVYYMVMVSDGKHSFPVRYTNKKDLALKSVKYYGGQFPDDRIYIEEKIEEITQ